MWDLPRPGLEPVSPALAGIFSTTAPPGKSEGVVLSAGSKARNRFRIGCSWEGEDAYRGLWEVSLARRSDTSLFPGGGGTWEDSVTARVEVEGIPDLMALIFSVK